MRLDLKKAWNSLPNFTNHDLWIEFTNIRKWANDQDSGLSPWTKISVNGDITDISPGSGLVVTTPDGTKTYRIYVDNSGQLTTLELT